MWTGTADNAIDEVKQAKKFFDDLFKKVGIEQEPIASLAQ